MKNKKLTLCLLLALIMLVALSACGQSASQPESTAEAPAKLVLGTSADYAPFEFMYPDDKGELVYGGIDISVAQYIADFTGKELQVENMGFDYLLASLQKGDFDIVIAAMESTEERLNSADFSDPYYTDYPPMVLVKAENADLKSAQETIQAALTTAEATQKSLQDELNTTNNKVWNSNIIFHQTIRNRQLFG